MTPGRIVYKCRRCGGLEKMTHVPDIRLAMSSMAVHGHTPEKWGLSVGMVSTHLCCDNAIGISDVIGTEREET